MLRMDALMTEAVALQNELMDLRRAIHREPELGFDLPNTQRLILKALEGLDVDIITGTSLSSVAVMVRGERPGPVVLLRADMDALPIKEETGLEYAATGDTMHACGHDLHVAGLVGAVKLLTQFKSELPGTVVCMFQPAEEVGQGAQRMIEEGVLELAGERPRAAFAIHVVPGEYGILSTRPGPIMAGAMEFRVTVTGKGGHASAPHLTIDPVPAVVQMVQDLNRFVARSFDVFDPVVLSVTNIQAGDGAFNVIPDRASFGGTIRVLSHEHQQRMEQELPELMRSIAEGHRCEVDVRVEASTPPTVNDVDVTSGAQAVAEQMFGGERVWESPSPVMGAEDFAYVLREIPGTLMFLRCSPTDLHPEEIAPNHSAKVIFDDRILTDQAALLAALAVDALQAQ